MARAFALRFRHGIAYCGNHHFLGDREVLAALRAPGPC